MTQTRLSKVQTSADLANAANCRYPYCPCSEKVGLFLRSRFCFDVCKDDIFATTIFIGNSEHWLVLTYHGFQ